VVGAVARDLAWTTLEFRKNMRFNAPCPALHLLICIFLSADAQDGKVIAMLEEPPFRLLFDNSMSFIEAPLLPLSRSLVLFPERPPLMLPERLRFRHVNRHSGLN